MTNYGLRITNYGLRAPKGGPWPSELRASFTARIVANNAIFDKQNNTNNPNLYELHEYAYS